MLGPFGCMVRRLLTRGLGDVETATSSGSRCEVSLKAASNGAGTETVTVRTEHAGEYRLVKIDVEGHEATVLGAAAEFFRRVTPDAVVFESHAKRGPFFARPEVAILAGMGYRFYAMHRGLVRVRFSPVLSDHDAAGAWYDYLALAPSKADEVLRMLGVLLRKPAPKEPAGRREET